MSSLASFVRLNRRLSALFDRYVLPEWDSVDGNLDFIHQFVPAFLRDGMCIYDVGGGKRPFLSRQTKEQLGLRVIGLDIDQAELARAPSRTYDKTVASDICTYRGDSDADVIICMAVLEHVADVEKAFEAFTTMLKPGGLLLLFVPSRNAVFARLNTILPESWKRAALFHLFPETRDRQGFPSYYDRCTPRDFVELARRYGMQVENARYYFISDYFSFLFPAYLSWRTWLVLFRALKGQQAAETFSMSIRKL